MYNEHCNRLHKDYVKFNHLSNLVREMAKNCRNEKYENLKIQCKDGDLRLNQVIALLIIPELIYVDTLASQDTVLVPDVSIQEIHSRMQSLFQFMNKDLDTKINEINSDPIYMLFRPQPTAKLLFSSSQTPSFSLPQSPLIPLSLATSLVPSLAPSLVPSLAPSLVPSLAPSLAPSPTNNDHQQFIQLPSALQDNPPQISNTVEKIINEELVNEFPDSEIIFFNESQFSDSSPADRLPSSGQGLRLSAAPMSGANDLISSTSNLVNLNNTPVMYSKGEHYLRSSDKMNSYQRQSVNVQRTMETRQYHHNNSIFQVHDGQQGHIQDGHEGHVQEGHEGHVQEGHEGHRGHIQESHEGHRGHIQEGHEGHRGHIQEGHEGHVQGKQHQYPFEEEAELVTTNDRGSVDGNTSAFDRAEDTSAFDRAEDTLAYDRAEDTSAYDRAEDTSAYDRAEDTSAYSEVCTFESEYTVATFDERKKENNYVTLVPVDQNRQVYVDVGNGLLQECRSSNLDQNEHMYSSSVASSSSSLTRDKAVILEKAETVAVKISGTEQSILLQLEKEGKIADEKSKISKKTPMLPIEMTKCDTCQKLVQRRNLKRHELLHSSTSKYSCTICDKQFPRAVHLNNHIKVHSNEKNFKCDVCGNSFRQNSELNKHKKIHATREHKCIECDKVFITNVKLQRHMWSHKDEKNYKCEVCSSTFNRIDNLKKHLKKSHGVQLPDLREHKLTSQRISTNE